MKRIILTILLSFCFLSCSEQNQNASPTEEEEEEEVSSDISTNFEAEDDGTTIDSIQLVHGDSLSLSVGEARNLYLTVHLNNGKVYHNVTRKFYTLHDHLKGNVLWYSNNSDIVTVSNRGTVIAMKSGSTTILATLQNKSTLLTVDVTKALSEIEDQDEENEDEDLPLDDSEESNEDDEETLPLALEDSFLKRGDVFETNLAADGGFNSDDLPDILYGPPVDIYDVVSLGSGGDIKIELNGRYIIDGDGDDFTIFENPFPGWQECAEVSVSANDQDYYIFSCNQFDAAEIYEGCAGVRDVNYGLSDEDYLDPNLSGGDSFDLADLSNTSLSTVKYIKITDIGLCQSTSLLRSGSPGGFDLDAVAILHGAYD